VTYDITRAKPTLDAIIVAHGPEPLLEGCVGSVLGSTGLEVRVLLVDNLCTNPSLNTLVEEPRVTMISNQTNDGFAGGVRRGLSNARASYVALVNSDVVVAEDALGALVTVLDDPSIGLVMPRILRRSDGLINSDGNPLHVLGYSWAGANGEIPQPGERRDIAVASGATLVARTSDLRDLDAPDPRFFLYHEDVDLSLACLQRGLRVVLEPSVTVHHDYIWDRNADKLMLAERNRLITVITRYPRRLLLRLLPLIIAVEIGVLVVGGLPGARRAKLRGYGWMLRHIRWIAARRAVNIARSNRHDAIVRMMTPRFDSAAPAAGYGLALLDSVLPVYLRAIGYRGLVSRSADPA